MSFGSTPFMTDDLDKMIRRRLEDVLRKRYGGRGADAALGGRRVPNPMQEGEPHAMGPLSPELNAMGPLSSERPRPSFGKRALANVGSGRGQRGIGAGIRAGRTSRNFGQGLIAGLGASLESGAAYDTSQAATQAQAAKDADKAQLDELTTLAHFVKPGSTHDTSLNTLEGMRGAGLSDEEIQDILKRRGMGGGRGGAGGGRVTDLDKVANSMVATGRAKDINEAYILARTILQQPQAVGSIARVTIDPNTFNTTTTRVGVARRMNQLTGDFETIDAQGNLVTPEDMKTFQQDPGGFQGGTGGPAIAPPAHPDFSDVVGGSSSTAPGGTPGAAPGAQAPAAGAQAPANPLSDYKPGLTPQSEQQIIQDLQDPSIAQDPRGLEIVRLYAAGRGPGGNSTRIKQVAAQILAAPR